MIDWFCKKSEKEKHDIKCSFLIILSCLFFLLLISYPFVFRDDKVHCSTIILIDCSDRFSERHMISIKNDLNILRSNIINNKDKKRKAIVFSIKGDAPSIPAPITSVVIDGKGLMSDRRWDNNNIKNIEKFFINTEKVISQSNESTETPIFEYLNHISKIFKKISAEDSELIIYSDFIQNVNHKWPRNAVKFDYSEYKKSKYYKDIMVNLKNIQVKMRYIEREKYRKIQTDEHREFWKRYFQDAGVKHIDFISIY